MRPGSIMGDQTHQERPGGDRTAAQRATKWGRKREGGSHVPAHPADRHTERAPSHGANAAPCVDVLSLSACAHTSRDGAPHVPGCDCSPCRQRRYPPDRNGNLLRPHGPREGTPSGAALLPLVPCCWSPGVELKAVDWPWSGSRPRANPPTPAPRISAHSGPAAPRRFTSPECPSFHKRRIAIAGTVPQVRGRLCAGCGSRFSLFFF